MISANAAAATVLISFGAVLGKVSPLQIIVMALLETPIYVYNAHLVLNKLQVADAGGSIFLHIFSTYFGLGVAFALDRKEDKPHPLKSTSYINDLLSLAGTIILWVYWPSFNGAFQEGPSRHRTIINNWLALLSSCVVTFGVSSMLDKRGKFAIAHIQASTLAGGVAVGSVVNLLIHPVGALALGAGSGLLCTLSCQYLTPWLSKRLRIHDTCGIHNLHGIPGLMAGFASVFMALTASESNYHSTLYDIYPAMAAEVLSPTPMTLHNTSSNYTGSSVGGFLLHLFGDVRNGSLFSNRGRNQHGQALFQLASIVITFVVSTLGGLLTGLFMKLPCWDQIPEERYYDDSKYWLLPSDNAETCSTPTNNHGREDNKI